MELQRKNILLFRGENRNALHLTLKKWRKRFIEKHGEMNLLDIREDNIFDGVLGDCTAPGFMGTTRMIIFHERLKKTEKEIEKMEQKNSEIIDVEKIFANKDNKKFIVDEDSLWMETMQKVPETNFIIFVGNKKPITELEKWLEKNATLHEFPKLSVGEIITYIESELRLPRMQAEKMSDRLGNDYDFVIQEVKKLSLAYKPAWSDDELKNILPDYRDENAFNMLDPLWNRDPKNIIDIWSRLMETADHELTMAMIITMIRKILISASFSRINNLPISPGQRYTGKKLLPYKKNLKKLYDDIVSVDTKEKSGELPNKTNAFLMALLNFCI